MPTYIRKQGQLIPLSIPNYDGERGEAGTAPNLQIGSTVTLPSNQQATVTVQGTKETPVLHFGIPEGSSGDSGLFIGNIEDVPNNSDVVFDNENGTHDLFFENATTDYMGEEYNSLKGKSDSDIEYILRKFGTQHYEGTNITAANTYAMQIKSAVFKGTNNRVTANGEVIDEDLKAPILDYDHFLNNANGQVAPYNGARSTHYLTCPTVRFKLQTQGSYPRVVFYNSNKTIISGFMLSPNQVIDPVTNAKYIRISVSSPYDIYVCDENGNKLDVFGDVETTLKSVKSPSLVSVGKNLFSDSFEIGSITGAGTNIFETNRVRTVNYIKVKPSTTYKIKDFSGLLTRYCVQYDKDKKIISEDGASNREVRTVVTKANTEYIRFTLVRANNNDFTEEELQLIKCMMVESETNPTEYEPHKSHTLATPSDLELRSNGNVCDELDLITGKLTQRIGEDGSVLTQPIIKTIDLQNQKVYSYDGTTHYMTSSLQGHPNPTLSIDVPTNTTSLIKHQQSIINQQRSILSKREEMQNILIDSMLSRYEQTLLTATHTSKEEIPNYIQKLYEVAYKRGIRTKEGEL